MELIFTNSQMGKSESALTSAGIKVTLVHRTKSNVIVYFGQELIAECRNKQEALEAVSAHMSKGN
jgi:thioredoxin-like negative regulator of GroEL